MKYIKNSFNLFINSFKLYKEILYGAFVDLIFYLFLFLIGYFFYSSFFQRLKEFSSLNIAGAGLEQIGMVARSFILNLFSMGFVAVVLFIFCYSIFKSTIWSITTKKKLDQEGRKYFSILSSLWLFFWIIFAFIFNFFLSVKNVIIFAFLFVLLNYFTKILFISFINNNFNIKKGFENMIDISLKKFYMFFLPYFFEFVVFIMLFFILFTIKTVPPNFFYPTSFLIFLLYSSWTRKYFSKVVGLIKL